MSLGSNGLFRCQESLRKFENVAAKFSFINFKTKKKSIKIKIKKLEYFIFGFYK